MEYCSLIERSNISVHDCELMNNRIHISLWYSEEKIVSNAKATRIFCNVWITWSLMKGWRNRSMIVWRINNKLYFGLSCFQSESRFNLHDIPKWVQFSNFSPPMKWLVHCFHQFISPFNSKKEKKTSFMKVTILHCSYYNNERMRNYPIDIYNCLEVIMQDLNCTLFFDLWLASDLFRVKLNRKQENIDLA